MEGKEEGPAARHSGSGAGEGGRRGREGAEGRRRPDPVAGEGGGGPSPAMGEGAPAREGEERRRPARVVPPRGEGAGRAPVKRKALVLPFTYTWGPQ